MACHLCGPLPTGRGGLDHIFVAVESCSKYVKLYPVKRCIEEYFTDVEKPKRLFSDNIPQFSSLQFGMEWNKTFNYFEVPSPVKPSERIMK